MFAVLWSSQECTFYHIYYNGKELDWNFVVIFYHFESTLKAKELNGFRYVSEEKTLDR